MLLTSPKLSICPFMRPLSIGWRQDVDTAVSEYILWYFLIQIFILSRFNSSQQNINSVYAQTPGKFALMAYIISSSQNLLIKCSGMLHLGTELKIYLASFVFAFLHCKWQRKVLDGAGQELSLCMLMRSNVKDLLEKETLLSLAVWQLVIELLLINIWG